MTQMPTQQEIEKQIAIYGVAVIGENGELLDPTKLKVDDDSKKVVIVGNHSAGLTKSLLAGVINPQTFAQVDVNYWDGLKKAERNEQAKVKTKMDISIPIMPLEYTICDTSRTEAKRIGNNKKHKKRKKK